MKVPKYVKKIIHQREKAGTDFVAYDSQLSDWLEKKGIFEKVSCGEKECLFNTGVAALESGTAQIIIEYLENLK